VKKYLGEDFELWNALVSQGGTSGHPREAARRLINEIEGYPRRPDWGSEIECLRRFFETSGGSAYIDSDHLEINAPEHLDAWDHVAIHHASLQLAAQAQVNANGKLGGSERIGVSAAVSDGRASWGYHLNVMVARSYFEALFARKPHLLAILAAHLATATIFAGQGQVGAGNDRAACDYQLSQRADWFEELTGLQTMQNRPLVNSRDQSHTTPHAARLHIIYFDNPMAPIAVYLMAGTTQLVCAMGEAGWIDPNLQLDDPLAAALEVSRDLSLRHRLPMAKRGLAMTAAEIQSALADQAEAFVASGQLEGAVPGAEAIIKCWKETIELVHRRDLDALARRCDWTLKYLLLDRHRGRKGLTWRSPELMYLNILYASVDREDGLFWRMAQAGQVEAMPDPERVSRFRDDPPDDSRAYLRAHLLRRFGASVQRIDWDHIRFRVQTNRRWWAETILSMLDLDRFGRAESEPLLEQCASLEELTEALDDLKGEGPSDARIRVRA
jgi:proteasome accessory factor A